MRSWTGSGRNRTRHYWFKWFFSGFFWGSVETEFNFISCVNLILSPPPPPTFAICFLVLCFGLLKLNVETNFFLSFNRLQSSYHKRTLKSQRWENQSEPSLLDPISYSPIRANNLSNSKHTSNLQTTYKT